MSASALAKLVAAAVVPGAVTFYLAAPAVGLPRPLAAPAALLGALWFMRVWIQDYYWDWRYAGPIPDCAGKTAVVTGGTIGGLGFASAEILAAAGANVVVTVRSDAKGEAAVARLRRGTAGAHSYVLCDFTKPASVRACAAELKARLDKIHYTVLNAGIASPAKPDGVAADVWMTNHVGPFLFAQEIQGLVEAAAAADGTRSVLCWVSSGAHKQAAINWVDTFDPSTRPGLGSAAYGQSKLANIMHAREYQRRNGGFAKCVAVTPGAVKTNLMTPPLPLLPLVWAVTRTPNLGAQVVAMACFDDALRGGEYLSNCYCKPTEGADGCSNDAAQWARLWALTEAQIASDAYTAARRRMLAARDDAVQPKNKSS